MATSLKARTPGYVIERTAKRLKRAFQKALLDLNAGITVDQWVVLDHIHRQPGLSQQEIGEATAKDKPTVTRILDRLEEKRLVRRKPSKDDRRKFGLYVTKFGQSKVSDLLPHVESFRLAHFEGLDDRDVEHFLAIMEKINSNINAGQTTNHALL